MLFNLYLIYVTLGLTSYDNPNPFVPQFEADLKCAACFSGIGFIQYAFLNNDFAQFCAEEIQPVCDFLSDPERHQKVSIVETKLDRTVSITFQET